MSRGVRALLLALAVACASVIGVPLATPAAAFEGDLRVVKVDTSRFPTIMVSFVKDDETKQLPNFTVTENGQVINDIKVYEGKIGQRVGDTKPAVMFLMDGSTSMRGAKLTNAKAAAGMLLAQGKQGDRFGVATFGRRAKVTLDPSEDPDAVRTAIADIELTKGTALYDAIVSGSEAFPSDANRRVIVLLSDGAHDIGSSSSGAKALKAMRSNGVELYTVVIKGSRFDPAKLREYSKKTGGAYESVQSATELSTVYERLGKELLRGYWLSYDSSQPPSTDVKVTFASTDYGAVTNAYTSPTAKPVKVADVSSKPPPKAAPEKPAIPLPTSAIGLIIAALPFGLILFLFGWRWMSKRSSPQLLNRLEPYTRQDPTTAAINAARAKKQGGSPLAGLYTLTESLLGKTSLFSRLRFLLEQANLPMREVEMLYVMVAGLGVGSAIAFLFMRSPFGLAVFPLLGFALPYVWLRRKAAKRRKAFEDQLADMLSTVAASLKAGHSFNQALTAVVKEAADPMAHELQRVMTEARLGLPTEAALDAMAKRMGSVDFDFAVTTVNIQRTVGGSLSEILEMVADTVRGRQQFRKKVKALTSMGRMSAYVLLGMPVFMVGVLSLLNPTYMEPLMHTSAGHKMLIAGGFFMFLGWFACNRIVAIKT